MGLRASWTTSEAYLAVWQRLEERFKLRCPHEHLETAQVNVWLTPYQFVQTRTKMYIAPSKHDLGRRLKRERDQFQISLSHSQDQNLRISLENFNRCLSIQTVSHLDLPSCSCRSSHLNFPIVVVATRSERRLSLVFSPSKPDDLRSTQPPLSCTFFITLYRHGQREEDNGEVERRDQTVKSGDVRREEQGGNKPVE